MDWAGPEFVVAMVAVCTGGWLINNWIRAKHGYALEDEWGGKTLKPDEAATVELRRQNAELRQRLEALESRAATLEAIVTDEGYKTARQIESLRTAKDKVIAQ